MLRIHFLNVGHGDCTLIEFPSGHITLVDINNSKIVDEETQKELLENTSSIDYFRSKGYTGNQLFEKSVSDFVSPVDPIEYLDEKISGTSLFRFILTHPDMDHMTGIHNLREKYSIINFWDTDNQKSVNESEVPSQYDYRDWEAYQDLRKSQENPKVLNILKGEQRSYFDEDGVRILSPTKEIIDTGNEKSKWNLLSYALLIEYAGHKIILGGDTDAEVWDELAEENADLLKDISVLKAPHHGRNSGYSQSAVSTMEPNWTVCSVGKKPAQDAHNKYRNYTKKKVLSTRYRGTIVAEITSSGNLTMYCEDNASPEDELHSLNTLV